MKLVGASNWFVRGPFMLEGLICGSSGSVLAVVLLFIGRELALPAIFSDTIKNAGDDVQAWSFGIVALILVAAGLCSVRSAPGSRCAASCASEPGLRRLSAPAHILGHLHHSPMRRAGAIVCGLALLAAGAGFWVYHQREV